MQRLSAQMCFKSAAADARSTELVRRESNWPVDQELALQDKSSVTTTSFQQTGGLQCVTMERRKIVGCCNVYDVYGSVTTLTVRFPVSVRIVPLEWGPVP